MAQDTAFYQKIERIFDRNTSPLIMGILNVTPDSFFDGGKYTTEQAFIEQTKNMIEAGAEIIDIGAYSTRPAAKEISEEEESKRLLPAILRIRKEFPEVLISADTFRAIIAEKAVNAGANIINDISGGTFDEKMFSTIAKLNVPYVLMHIQGTPQTMQLNPHYKNVVDEVAAFFEEKIEKLKKLGVKKLILDPGFGFGKTVEHNFLLLKNLEKFQSSGFPVLAGLSRKSMINKLLNISSKDSLNGTSVLNMIALQNGAKIVRVHDVKEAKEVIKIYEYLKAL
ncbi:MAG: dihydropteroate synthase [Bacteroidia bacterium]